VITNVMSLFTPQAHAKGLAIRSSIDERVPHRVKGDSGRLRQILTNLMGNAMKFTERGGVKIRVSLESDTGAEVVVKFAVRDTGVGIPRRKAHLLFEKFTQLDGAMSRKYGGTGLGLAICKHLAALLNGEIGVTSEPGQGSDFWVTVPFGKAEPAAQEMRLPLPLVTEPVELPSARILLAEDNLVNQKVVTAMLTKLGMKVDVVSNGLQSLLALQRATYDLVLMDVQMPEMDGLQATELIRSVEGKTLDTAVPIVALTANAMESDRARCMEAGMDDYLSKPIDFGALERTLALWLRHPEDEIETSADRPGCDSVGRA